MQFFDVVIQGISALGWQQVVMIGVGGVLIYLAIVKEFEPTLLLPIGFGAILVNLPLHTAWEYTMGGELEPGPLQVLYNAGIRNELFPLLIFVAIGAMIDFSPLLRNPVMLLFGAAAQLGVFGTMVVASVFGFTLKQSAAIGIIGAADGPTSIYVSNMFAPELLGPISVAAYSYMSLVPIIQPPVIKALTSREERMIRMEFHPRPVSRVTLILFPITLTVLAGTLVPTAASLVGFLMFGNLLRECGVVERLSKGAQNELANLVTILLGITIGGTMKGAQFLQPWTILILAMGLVAFVLDTAGGVLFAKGLNVFLKNKVNPMIGACGISAFPMSARVIHTMAQKEDPQNVLLMHAVGTNVGGQIGSVVAGGLVITFLTAYLAGA